MEDIYVTNVKVQSVYCIKDAYGTLVWKTHLVDSSYKGGIWNTRVEDSSRRLVWKTSLEDSFINIIKDIWNIWKTLIRKTLEDSYKHYLEYGRLWNSHMDYFYRRLLWHTYVHLL